MAKTTKNKVKEPVAIAEPVYQPKPRIYFDQETTIPKALQNAEVGKTVELVVKAKVSGRSESTSPWDGRERKSVELEISNVKPKKKDAKPTTKKATSKNKK